MSALKELIERKVFQWPEGFDMLCVSKRSQWMLRGATGTTSEDREDASAFFARLGPCSSIYRHQSYSLVEFNKLQSQRAAQ